MKSVRFQMIWAVSLAVLYGVSVERMVKRRAINAPEKTR